MLAGFIALGSHVIAPPRPPSDEVMIPRCMSWTGGNSSLPVVHLAAVDGPMVLPIASTQFGDTKRLIMSGTAWARSACLSPIDAELSIMKRRSSLSTDWLWMTLVNVVFRLGCQVSTGRVRHAAPTTPNTAMALSSAVRSLRLRFMIHGSSSVDRRRLTTYHGPRTLCEEEARRPRIGGDPASTAPIPPISRSYTTDLAPRLR